VAVADMAASPLVIAGTDRPTAKCPKAVCRDRHPDMDDAAFSFARRG
jgi:hypothetical protein